MSVNLLLHYHKITSFTLTKMASILRRIQLARNDKVFEGKDRTPQNILSVAISLHEEFRRLQFHISTSS